MKNPKNKPDFTKSTISDGYISNEICIKFNKEELPKVEEVIKSKLQMAYYLQHYNDLYKESAIEFAKLHLLVILKSINAKMDLFSNSYEDLSLGQRGAYDAYLNIKREIEQQLKLVE